MTHRREREPDDMDASYSERVSKKKNEVCRDYRGGNCRRGHNCPYIHNEEEKRELCRDFQRGHCNRGDLCPFIHTSSSRDRDRERERDRGRERERDPIRERDRDPIRERDRDPIRERDRDGREVCRDFVRGFCRRGLRCPYVHPVHTTSRDPGILPASYSERPKTTQNPEVCRDHLFRDNCARGSRCPYLHVVMDDKDTKKRPSKRRRIETDEEEGEIEESGVRSQELESLREENKLLREENILLREDNRLFRLKNTELNSDNDHNLPDIDTDDDTPI